MAETTYDPYADSDIGRRAFGGEYIDSMNFFWFNPNTQEVGSTTEGWSRVPDEHKRYTYLNPGARDAAETKFFQSGASGIGVGGKGGNNLLSGLDFARSIAGGEAAASMIAPGMSYSMDQPMGYTQADLNNENRFYSEGPVPVRPDLPPTGNNYTQIPNQMPYAPPGTTVEKFPNSLLSGGMYTASELEKLGITPTPSDGGMFGKAGRVDSQAYNEILEPVIDFASRPATVSPLGSLDTTYLNDINFSGLLGTPSPQADFPIAPLEVIESAMANQPVYQDPIMSMVEPVVNNEIIATDIIPEPSYPSLGASLFDNVNIIPEAPEPMPLVNASVSTPESNVDINALQNLVNNIGLLNEPIAVPQNNTPSMPLNIFDAPINFNPARNYGR